MSQTIEVNSKEQLDALLADLESNLQGESMDDKLNELQQTSQISELLGSVIKEHILTGVEALRDKNEDENYQSALDDVVLVIQEHIKKCDSTSMLVTMVAMKLMMAEIKEAKDGGESTEA